MKNKILLIGIMLFLIGCSDKEENEITSSYQGQPEYTEQDKINKSQKKPHVSEGLKKQRHIVDSVKIKGLD